MTPPHGPTLCVVDAFTRVPFRGNPAAVCLLDAPAPETWMRQVAAEMNLSETAFLVPGGDAWDLRWFTPTVEVDLCGHATLASAQALWDLNCLAPSAPAVFETLRSGRLTCRRDGDWIAMDFPARPARVATPPAGLLEALGCEARWAGRSADDFLIEVADSEVVRGLDPDHARLRVMPVRGVIVTALDKDARYDMVSRFFAPGSGIDEDPVTGSAHCTLGPFWAGRLGRTELRAWQASPRGGEVRLRVLGDRVELSGQAVVIWRGSLAAPPGTDP